MTPRAPKPLTHHRQARACGTLARTLLAAASLLGCSEAEVEQSSIARSAEGLSAGVSLKVQYHHANDTQPGDSSIASFIRIVNTGTVPVPLGSLTIRYWFDPDGTTSQQIDCYWAALGCSSLGLLTAPSGSSAASAASVYQIHLFAPGTLAPGQNTGDIQTRIHKTNWSNYNELDDYSYVPGRVAWADAPKIALYVDGELAWGNPPPASGPSCFDGIRNGTETGVDCGGACPACPTGSACQTAGDCQSGRCEGAICQPAPEVSVSCASGLSVVSGTNGVDNFNNIGVNACIDAKDGNDSINGQAGGDGVVLAGSGNDQVTVTGPHVVAGGDGADNINTTGPGLQLFGQAGSDTLNVNDAPEAIAMAGDGNDLVSAGNAPGALVSGGPGIDTLNVTGDGAVVEGNAGDDDIRAAGSGLRVYGGPGRDRIILNGTGSVVVNDVCELASGESYVGSGAGSTLTLPVSAADAQALGVSIQNFGSVLLDTTLSGLSECASLGLSPRLWAVYHEPGASAELPGRFVVRETVPGDGSGGGVFRDPSASVRHTGVSDVASSVTRPAVTHHGNSHWVTWLEGNTIYAKTLDWGPGYRKTVYTGTGTLTAPAIASFVPEGETTPRLVVVWREDNRLVFSTSTFGVDWTAPVSTATNTTVSQLSVAAHGGSLWVGVTSGTRSVMLTQIRDDLAWGPNFSVFTAAPTSTILPSISVASNGERISVAFSEQPDATNPNAITLKVTHAANATGSFGTPATILSGVNVGVAPALSYFGGYLYAAFPTPTRVLVRRSPDGSNWLVPTFVVEAEADTRSAMVALLPSDYAPAPPQPEVVPLIASGRDASEVFNVVIAADGFELGAMDQFRELAESVADTFRATNPFSKHMDKFNVLRVDLLSRESGVDASPALAAAVRAKFPDLSDFQARYRDTSLGSHYHACWDENPPHDNTAFDPGHGVSSVGLCDAGEESGNQHTTLSSQKNLHIFQRYAYDRIEQWVPGFDRERDVLYVISNMAPEDGGYTKDSKNPIVTDPAFAGAFTWLHEMGHFMTSLGDEDFEAHCRDSNCTSEYNNKTNNGDITDPNHKWAHHFVFEGPDGPADPRGQSIVANPKTRPPSSGDFWDTEFVNGNHIFNTGLWATNGVSDWGGGPITYGSSPQCLMNHTGTNTHYCPVCTEYMTGLLTGLGGGSFNDAAYHGEYDRVYVEYKNWDQTENAPGGRLSVPGLVALNGTSVADTAYRCTDLQDDTMTVCSVDVTPWLLNGSNRLVFQAAARPPSNSGQLQLLSLQVVNSNGAPLTLLPITDLSDVGNSNYLSNYLWRFENGDLEFQFDAELASP